MSEVMIKGDDGYNELDGIFNKDIEIPGDEVTGEIKTVDDVEDADDTTDTDSTDIADAADTDTADDKDTEETDAAIEEDVEQDSGDESEVDTEEAEVDAIVPETEVDNEAELRASLREQQRKIALTEAKLDTYSRQRKADIDAEENAEDVSDVEPSAIEAHQAALNNIANTRGDVISDMLELMVVNPKYEDVESVCSKNNLDDTIETLAKAQVAKEGGDLVEITMGLEVDIWSQRNPYRYMYGLIKDIHPKYNSGDKQDTTNDADVKTKKAPAKAPLSAVDLTRGGGGKDHGEWTAEKIDNLPEDELSSVPTDVYDLYLRGDLDK